MLGDKDISQRVIQVVTQDSKYAKADSENFMPIESSDYYKAADIKTKNALKGKGLLVSINPVAIDKTNATYQNFTNGMLNHEALAIKNAIDQTGSDVVSINYNSIHGFLGNNKGENMSNPNRSIIDTIKDGGLLFDLGGESPHSTYDCQSNPNAHCGKRAW